ncbi:unnamed protein product [Closterium sp. NIES-64]|nr:unnamed protein product [Closterium sp. NIES-64]
MSAGDLALLAASLVWVPRDSPSLALVSFPSLLALRFSSLVGIPYPLDLAFHARLVRRVPSMQPALLPVPSQAGFPLLPQPRALVAAAAAPFPLDAGQSRSLGPPPPLPWHLPPQPLPGPRGGRYQPCSEPPQTAYLRVLAPPPLRRQRGRGSRCISPYAIAPILFSVPVASPFVVAVLLARRPLARLVLDRSFTLSPHNSRPAIYNWAWLVIAAATTAPPPPAPPSLVPILVALFAYSYPPRLDVNVSAPPADRGLPPLVPPPCVPRCHHPLVPGSRLPVARFGFNEDEVSGTPRDPDVDWWGVLWPHVPREGNWGTPPPSPPWGEPRPGDGAYQSRGMRLSEVGRCVTELSFVLDLLHYALQSREVVARDPQLSEDQQRRVRRAVSNALWDVLHLPLEPEDPLLDDGPCFAAFRMVATAAEESPPGIVPALACVLRWLGRRVERM